MENSTYNQNFNIQSNVWVSFSFFLKKDRACKKHSAGCTRLQCAIITSVPFAAPGVTDAKLLFVSLQIEWQWQVRSERNDSCKSVCVIEYMGEKSLQISLTGQ